MRTFEYLKPIALGETLELITEHGPKAKVIAGGTDLMIHFLSVTFDAALPEGLRISFGGCGGRAVPATFESVHPQEAGTVLEKEYEISVRFGLHCAPLAHQARASFPDGTVRFSLSYFNTLEEVQIAVQAVKRIATKMDTFEDS